ncbi:MAG: TetR/AcrR family transcriptional regulator, repressor of fatR-cypB operon [Clostridia bacterium]|nr:TetR/AcrR family transcriptional regulator, repressor of fatR-cypB operon [Clostridia bacterium]
MARPIDPTKIEKIKKAAMDLIVKYGYRGASIGAIAKKAGVSTGYLYRHYESKDELIEDLIESNLKKFHEIFCKTMDEKSTAKDIIYNFVNILFSVAITNPILAKFLCALVFDQNFQVKKRRENDKRVRELVSDVLRIGIKNGEINLKTTLEEIMLVLFTITFSYISMNINENYNEEKFGEKQAGRITEICLNALK